MSRRGVSAAISIAILLPVLVFISMGILNVYVKIRMTQQAGVGQAELVAGAGKEYLRVTALRGPSNETLINLQGAGKFSITVDYLMVIASNGSVIVEREGPIITVNPGDNVTIRPSRLDPRLAPYDGDYWRAKRELSQVIFHSSDGNTILLSWGPWGGRAAATYTRTETETRYVTRTDTIYVTVTETRTETRTATTQTTTTQTTTTTTTTTGGGGGGGGTPPYYPI